MDDQDYDDITAEVHSEARALRSFKPRAWGA